MPRSAGNFFLIIKDPRVCGGQRCRVSQGLVGVEEREREISYGETARTRRTSRHLTRELACSSIPRNLEVLNFSIVGIESRRSIHTSLRYLPAGVKDIDPIHSRIARRRNTSRENSEYRRLEGWGSLWKHRISFFPFPGE